MVTSFFVVLLASTVYGVHAYPSGPPVSACGDLMPGVPHGTDVQTGNGGFEIATNLPMNPSGGFDYTANQTYTVVLNGSVSTFLGFLIQARSVPGDMLIGTFEVRNSFQLHLPCPDAMGNVVQATITHSNGELMEFNSQTFVWHAPSETSGTVEFRYTVVHVQAIFYTALTASENLYVPVNPVTNPSGVPAPITTAPSASSSSGFSFRIPPGCVDSSCSYLATITPSSNNGELDFCIEGTATAWVAIGFSETPDMFSADVFGCNNPGTGIIEAVDTWNLGNERNNVGDDTQGDIVITSRMLQNGRISCCFSRTIIGSNPGQDLNLNESLYGLYGFSNNPNPVAGRLVSHIPGGAPLPSVTTERIIPSSFMGEGIGDDFPRSELIRAHGILMLIAWPLIGCTAIFFASYMKKALPNGEWFQVHRAFMIVSLFVTAAAFVLAFVAQLRRPTPGLIDLGSNNKIRTAHFAFGILVMFLQILNPILAIFRCKPNESKRWIFNFFHGYFVGLLTEISAYVNVGLGLVIFTDYFSRFNDTDVPFWLYIAYVLFITILHLVMNFIHQVCRDKKTRVDEDTELKERERGTDQLGPKKVPAKGSIYHWIGFGVFLVITIPVIVVLIILVALPI